MGTSGANKGFMAIQHQWRHIIATQSEEKLEPKWEKLKTTWNTKAENPLAFLMKTETQTVKKKENLQTAMNTKIEKPFTLSFCGQDLTSYQHVCEMMAMLERNLQ